jgi:hypothetical protein
MKCFRHPDLDALGICKQCGKGLCGLCVADTGSGLACKNSCEKRVFELALLNNPKSNLVIRGFAGLALATVCLSAAAGAIGTAAIGAVELQFSAFFTAGLTLLGLAAGGLSAYEFSLCFKKSKSPPPKAIASFQEPTHEPDHLEDHFRKLEQNK